MTSEYYTTITASGSFWERLVSEKLLSKIPVDFIGEESGFTIRSNDGPAIWDMIVLSKEYPNERFNVVVTTNNKYKDVIEYYEFQSGATFFNHLEPLYHFDMSEEVNREAGSTIIDEFKVEIIEALEKINVFVPSYEYVIGCELQTKEMVSNIQFEYGYQEITLSAIVIGQTYIKIDLESVHDEIETPNMKEIQVLIKEDQRDLEVFEFYIEDHLEEEPYEDDFEFRFQRYGRDMPYLPLKINNLI